MQISLLHLLSERQIGAGVAFGGVLQDRAEALRREAGGNAVLMGAPDAGDSRGGDLLGEELHDDRPAIGAENGRGAGAHQCCLMYS